MLCSQCVLCKYLHICELYAKQTNINLIINFKMFKDKNKYKSTKNISLNIKLLLLFDAKDFFHVYFCKHSLMCYETLKTKTFPFHSSTNYINTFNITVKC